MPVPTAMPVTRPTAIWSIISPNIKPNAVPIAKGRAEAALESAACIGCGACVAACPNASASLFVGAKVAHLAQLPQRNPERGERVRGL